MSEPRELQDLLESIIEQLGKLDRDIERSGGHNGYMVTGTTTGIHYDHVGLVILADTVIDTWRSENGTDLKALFGMTGTLDTNYPTIYVPKGMGQGQYIKLTSGKVGLVNG